MKENTESEFALLYGAQIYAERLGNDWRSELNTIRSIADKYPSFQGYGFHKNTWEKEPRPVFLFTELEHAKKCVTASNFILNHAEPAVELLETIGYGKIKKKHAEKEVGNQRRS